MPVMGGRSCGLLQGISAFRSDSRMLPRRLETDSLLVRLLPSSGCAALCIQDASRDLRMFTKDGRFLVRASPQGVSMCRFGGGFRPVGERDEKETPCDG